jgi:quercetin dioxygenase-like cupin family protein
MTTTFKITTWSKDTPPTEAGLRQVLHAQGLQPYRWSNSPGDTYSPHLHSYNKVIYVVEGSITFGLPQEGITAALSAGDRLDMPAGTLHDARVGPQGVVCLEAHAQGAEP